ncbi:diacylglycerol kinase family enzyme [Humitalea rosea]|uniref:Diacylglycerol kinase family enzyme n=1 Tax=Humitalea rosea TaxID=990373 RepID=A0A2W7IMW5_9PROT|nr:diacylglycerol kinase family protein [Humitalea rosea]PZW47115.1 diacylglycerol kinase family enzyme [Humitalea rosea]
MNRPYRALRMLIVFNPTAGARRRRRLAEALRALAIAGVVARVAETGAPGDARRFAAEAAAAGETAVVAAGGDGTIAEVAAGLAGSAATLGILPFGTANVLALELGLPLGPAQAARVLAAGQRRLVWPGIARFADGSSRLFVQMLGAGFDAAVVAGLDLRLKQRIGRAAYVWQSARELCRYGFPPMTVTLDGAAFQVGSAIVTKGRLYAGRFLLAPAARPDAPGFQVALFHHAGPWSAALYGVALPLGLLSRMPGVEIRAASRIEFAGAGIPVQADGDAVGEVPVSVADAPGPMQVLVG